MNKIKSIENAYTLDTKLALKNVESNLAEILKTENLKEHLIGNEAGFKSLVGIIATSLKLFNSHLNFNEITEHDISIINIENKFADIVHTIKFE